MSPNHYSILKLPRSVSFCIIGLCSLLIACSGAQIDRGDTSDFAAKGYQTYNWNYADIEVLPGDGGSDAIERPIFRQETNRQLAKLGYERVDAGGDFVVSLRFRSSIEDGALPRMREQNPLVPPRIVANRMPDQASVDNAHALAGPREVSNVLLQFDDGQDRNPLWAATMSQVLETANPNEIEADDVRRYAREALRRAMIGVPKAPN